MKTVHVRNVGGDKHDQIFSAYESIGNSKQRLEVFLWPLIPLEFFHSVPY